MYQTICNQHDVDETVTEKHMDELLDHEVNSALYQDKLDRFVHDFDLAAGAVLATPDGLLVANAARSEEIEADAIAAMSASMLSLADALAGQAGRAYADNIISEAESSTLVVMHAGKLILTVVGNPHVNIGMILTATRRTADSVAKLLKKDKGVVKGHEILADPEALLEQVKRELLELRKKEEK